MQSETRSTTRSMRFRWLVLYGVTTGCGGSATLAAAAAFWCGGCAGPVEEVRLVDHGTLASVSTHQKYMAFYETMAPLPTGAPSGPLAVMPLPDGDLKGITEDVAFGATFNSSGLALVYSLDPTPTTDLAATEIYGGLGVWTPSLDRGVRLTNGFAVFHAEPADNAFTLLWDAEKPTVNATGNVVLVRTGECASGACSPKVLATGVTVTGFEISPDSKHAVYSVRSDVGATTTLATFLVSIADGTSVEVARTEASLDLAPFAFSPDGSLLASAVTKGGIRESLQVISTATGAPVPWAAPPATARCHQFAFVDDKTLIARTVDSDESHDVYRLTSDHQEHIGSDVKYFVMSERSTGARRYLFAATTRPVGAGGNEDAELYDLAAAQPSPVPVATGVPVLPTLSDDLRYARFLGSFDPASALGELGVVSLPDGKVTSVAKDIAEVGGAAFAAGGARLLYIDAGATPASGATPRAGALRKWQDGVTRTIASNVINFRTRESPDVLYYAVASGSGEPGIYAVPLDE